MFRNRLSFHEGLYDVPCAGRGLIACLGRCR